MKYSYLETQSRRANKSFIIVLIGQNRVIMYNKNDRFFILKMYTFTDCAY
jgi:hypothetical protein